MKKMLFSTLALICLTAVTLACGAKVNSNGSQTSTAASTDSASASAATSPSSTSTSAPTTNAATTPASSPASTPASSPTATTSVATTSPTPTATTGTATTTTAAIGPGTNYPAPPANAVVFANAQNTTNTGSCNTSSCSGGSGTGTSWIAFNQTTPAVSGSSTELYNSGAGFDTLWYWHLGANDAVSNIELDFNLMVDSASQTGTQAIENGPQQYVGGYKYSMTMQCEYTTQMWRVWNQAAGGWSATNVACPHWSPNVWHHVQMYITTNQTNHTETYHTLIVDGVPNSLEVTYGVTNVGFADNLGFQFQLDNNGSGAVINEWLDKVTFTVW